MLKFSAYEKAFEELLENEGLKKKAAKSGISYGTLKKVYNRGCLLYTSPSPRDGLLSRMPSSA